MGCCNEKRPVNFTGCKSYEDLSDMINQQITRIDMLLNCYIIEQKNKQNNADTLRDTVNSTTEEKLVKSDYKDFVEFGEKEYEYYLKLKLYTIKVKSKLEINHRVNSKNKESSSVNLIDYIEYLNSMYYTEDTTDLHTLENVFHKIETQLK